jgi:O-methyltransferase/methyltransferase family protein
MTQEPAATLRTMLFGYFPAQAVHVAARLGLADHLADGPKPAADLAESTGCDPGALPRLLRALAGLGVLEQPQPGTFALTSVGELLRADHPSSLRNYALLFCGEPCWQSWGDLEYSVRTGKSAWERRYGPPFSASGVDPEFSAIFNAAMAEGAGRAAPALIAAAGFGRFATIADLGGGRGVLLAAILAEHPAARGILFDLPLAVQDAPGALAAAGVADRCEVVAGDFFQAVPGGADAYLLKSVIHDWDDERAAAILTSAHRAMPPEATLLLAEPVASAQPAAGEQFSVSFSDLNMLVCTSGRERTEQEFRSLLTAAGFALQQITPCPPTGYSILEATPQP